jgi:hypothetical protein
MAVEALNIVADSYLEERAKFDNSNMVNERDTLVTHIETPFTPSCASIRGEYKEGFKEHTLSSAAFDI